MDDVCVFWDSATTANFGGATDLLVVGSFSGDVLLDVIAHVEAAAGGKAATVISFVFNVDVLYIIAVDEKYIIGFYEGQSTIVMDDPTDKKDVTQHYLHGRNMALGLLLPENCAH